MDLELPLIFAKGFPATLNSLSETQLQCFLKYLWDFLKVPNSSQIFPDEDFTPQERIKMLRQTVQNVYDRLGCSYLVNFSDGIAECNHTSLLFDVESKSGVVYIWNKRNGKILAKIPQSNLTYDLNLEISESKSPKKKDSQVIRNVTNNLAFKTIDEDKAKNNRTSSICNDVITIEESDSEILEISDEDEPNEPDPIPQPNPQVSSIIEIIEDDETQMEETETDAFPNVVCEKVWSESVGPEVIELSDSEEETCTERSEDILRRLLISHHSKGQQPTLNNNRKKTSPRKNRDPEPPPLPVQSDKTAELPDKSTFLQYFGLCEPHNLPDDPIILPELKKCDFVKFHRLPLSTVPFLANNDLIHKSALDPGPPGQISKLVSDDENPPDKKRNVRTSSYRMVLSRFKTKDLENAMDYKYPTKTYRTVPPAPLPKRRSKPKQTKSDRPRNNNKKPTPSSSQHVNVKLKECSVRIVKLNPIIFKKYYVKRK